MRYLIATDSFKDALPAAEVCTAIARGLQLADPSASTVLLPLADGGEGTAEVLTTLTQGEQVPCRVRDPLGRSVEAYYGWQATSKTAFIDMAAASGLQLLQPEERNPMLTSTYGTGELIQDAIGRGAAKIVLGIGGSATNDGGMGMATALGHQFLDAEGKRLFGTGADLSNVAEWLPTQEDLPPVEVLCDVDNTLFGPGRGAAYVYGPQKGATPPIYVLAPAHRRTGHPWGCSRESRAVHRATCTNRWPRAPWSATAGHRPVFRQIRG